MSRFLTLGNGEMLVGIDRFAQVRDLYFPRVGLENQVDSHRVHRVGVFVDGRLSWTSENSWSVSVDCESESLIGRTEADNDSQGIHLSITDGVYNEKNIFVRKIVVTNKEKRGREIRLFLGNQFELYGSHNPETAYFDPSRHVLTHYKGQRVVVINGELEGAPFSDWSIGLLGTEGKDGTFRDAEDGVLSKNPIEHGPIDSVISFNGFYGEGESKTIHYWLCIGRSLSEACSLNDYVLQKSPDHILETTGDYWNAWINKRSVSFLDLPEEVVTLFKKSLMIIRAHADSEGSIIASSDSDLLQFGRDTYAYTWPRDASRAAITLARTGDLNVARRFFEFCNDIITNDGYFMLKYLPDKSIGGSWHPRIRDGKPQLPIQEDETAIVIYALWRYYEHSHDLEFIEAVYKSLIEKAAEFLLHYRDEATGLPKGSYDLWEEKYGTSTFTAATVYGALLAAANFSKLLGKDRHEERYRKGASEVRDGILKYLYDKGSGNFYKLIQLGEKGEIASIDKTIDASSVYGVFNFEVLEPGDPRVKRAMKNTVETLTRNVKIGGLVRYENDNYYRTSTEAPGNPWFITTLWYAEYLTAVAQTEKEFEEAKKWLLWCVRHALPSGILSEQLNPFTGEQVAAAPLVWSHAEYANAIIKYLRRLERLGRKGGSKKHDS